MLAQHKNLQSLRTLDLRYTKIGDAGLSEIAAFRPTARAIVSQTKVTDAGLKVLAGLNLRILEIPKECWTDVGLERYLAATRPAGKLKIGNDYAGEWQMTDAGLKMLADRKELHFVSLYNCTKITDEGLKELAGLTNLHTLILYRTQVTDEGLKHLAGLKSLRPRYNLEATKVTAVGLKQLAGRGLTSLTIPHHARTDAGLKHYVAACPPDASLNLGNRGELTMRA